MNGRLSGLLIPPGKRGGNKRRVDVREVINGIMYILSTGCQWRAVPKDLPPRSTLFDYLDLWSYDGTLDRIHHALYMECREQGEREASPTAAIIDSQSVKSAEKGGLASIHMAMMHTGSRREETPYSRRHARPAAHAIVHPADIQDRDGGILLLATLFGMYPFLKKLFADGAYQGPIPEAPGEVSSPTSKPKSSSAPSTAGFVVLPRRWIVGAPLLGSTAAEGLQRIPENLIAARSRFSRLASIRLMLRKLCNPA